MLHVLIIQLLIQFIVNLVFMDTICNQLTLVILLVRPIILSIIGTELVMLVLLNVENVLVQIQMLVLVVVQENIF